MASSNASSLIKVSADCLFPCFIRGTSIFESKKESASSSCLLPDDWNDNKAWTKTVVQIFEEIGRELGYGPRTEYLDIVMTWAVRHEDISAIIAAIEHENGDLSDVIDDELQKLMDVKAYLKVLMFYPRMPVVLGKEAQLPQIMEKVQSANIKTSEEKNLVITPVIKRGQLGHAEFIEVFHARLIQTENGKIWEAFL